MSHVSKAIWGPACWQMLHSTAATLTDVDAFLRLLRDLGSLLPCPECRNHLNAHLSAFPPEACITNKETASQYCFDLHNAVNRRSGRPICSPATVRERYRISVKASPASMLLSRDFKWFTRI